MNQRFKYTLASFLLSVASLTQAEFIVSYRVSGGVYTNYHKDLITLALEKTRPDYGDYRLQGVTILENERTLAAAASNQYPNLLIERIYEEGLTASNKLTFVNFPIDLGISGYRVCFINPAIKEKIKKIQSLAELQQYSHIQGIGWADAIILRHNNFNVIESSNYTGMLKMIIAGRADLFCRGANEILTDYEVNKDLLGLQHDDSFSLHYPLPRFFYLSSQNKLAKDRITAGLKRAYQDGSLKKLWIKFYQPSVIFSNLKKREIFHLENPLLKKLSRDYEQYFVDPIDK